MHSRQLRDKRPVSQTSSCTSWIGILFEFLEHPEIDRLLQLLPFPRELLFFLLLFLAPVRRDDNEPLLRPIDQVTDIEATG